MMRNSLTIACVCLALAACGGEQHSDLRQFVKDSDNLPRGRIPPLPEVRAYEPFPYTAYDLTDPFKPRKTEIVAKQSQPRPELDPNRRRERSKRFRWKPEDGGTLQQKQEVYAVVKTPDNRLSGSARNLSARTSAASRRFRITIKLKN